MHVLLNYHNIRLSYLLAAQVVDAALEHDSVTRSDRVVVFHGFEARSVRGRRGVVWRRVMRESRIICAESERPVSAPSGD